MSMKSAIIAPLRRRAAGFTLAELLVSVLVVVIITVMASQLMSSAWAIARNGHKHFDTDTSARVVLDRMALDFAQMVKRTDVDYYVKQKVYKGHGNGHGCGHGHNGDLTSDQIAFYSQVPAYNPDPSTYSSTKQSPISLIAYRVNESTARSEEHTSELQSQSNLVCRLLLEKKHIPIVFISLIYIDPVAVVAYIGLYTLGRVIPIMISGLMLQDIRLRFSKMVLGTRSSSIG